MPDVSGYDIQIASGGTTYDLKLDRDRSGALALQFVDAPDEPGTRGLVRTIKFDDLHHGLGADLAIEGDRYTSCRDWQTMRPGRIEMLGNRLTLYDVDIGPGNINTGPVETAEIFAQSFQWEGVSYFILPSKLILTAFPVPWWTALASPPAGMEYRGPAAFYQGNFFFGLQDATTGLSTGHSGVATVSGSIITNDAVVDPTLNRGSLFHAAHGGLWCIEITTAEAGHPAEAIGWKLKFCDAADATLDANWTVLGVEQFNPFPTTLYSFGRWIMLFGADGQLLALSETPPNKTLIAPGVLEEHSNEFGVGARQFGEFLLVPTTKGLYAIPFTDFRLRDFAPHSLQGRVGADIIRPVSFAPYGIDAIVGTRSDDADKVRLMALRRYPEGIFYNEFFHEALHTTAKYSIRAVEFINEHAFAVMLIGNATDGRIIIQGFPSDSGGRPPAILPGAIQGLAPTAELITAHTYGPSPGRKLFTGIRGWVESVITLGSGILLFELSVDGGAFLTIHAATAAGPFVGNAQQQIGRTAALRIKGQVTADNGTDWPVIRTPIYLDYVEEPSGGFRIQMDILAGGGARRSGSRTQHRENLLSTLHGLIGKDATIKVIESQQTYDVMIEEVRMDDSVAPGRERPQAVIKLAAKVVPDLVVL